MMGSVPSKTVGGRTYLHVDALSLLDAERAARVAAAERLAQVKRHEHFNLVRIDDAGPWIALLNYPEFADDPFPALRESWLVDLDRSTVGYRTYADSLNPPILHRKELLLLPDDPRREGYAELTRIAESIGLFEDPKRIGYRRQWLHLVQEKGYRLVGHTLAPLGNDESAESEAEAAQLPLHVGWQAARQLTALARYGFSAPVQSLARHGFLDGRFSLFDYGCGRGDDVRGLAENGLAAAGWDPYYAPDQPIHPADIVNLGFVVNVIEDFDERLEALTRAWSLAERLLVVSVMLANQNEPRGQRFRDGVLTQRGTFQKYYTQAEIKAFIEAALDEEPIPVAPGVLYVFRDQEVEQRFLVDRYRNRRHLLRYPAAPVRERATPRRRDRSAEKYEAYREPLDRLWERWVALGRPPDPSEVEDLVALTEGFGNLGRALRFIGERHDADAIQRSRQSRIADLQVYFALSQFEHRRPYKHLEPGLQRDHVNEEFPYYPEQVAFEEVLDGLELFDFSGYGPSPGEFLATLARNRWTLDGFALTRATTLPALDDPCGRYLTFRQLIECGETQARIGLANRPQQPASYNALHDLAARVLDPVIDYFGMIRLTYGFCSPELARKIPGRIDPQRDQHAAHEVNRRGQPICKRLGAAVDFLIDDENMLEVAQWIVAHTPFDRLYFYGADQPLHVSFGPNQDRQIVWMVATPSGRRVPQVLAREQFLALL